MDGAYKTFFKATNKSPFEVGTEIAGESESRDMHDMGDLQPCQEPGLSSKHRSIPPRSRQRLKKG